MRRSSEHVLLSRGRMPSKVRAAKVILWLVAGFAFLRTLQSFCLLLLRQLPCLQLLVAIIIHCIELLFTVLTYTLY